MSYEISERFELPNGIGNWDCVIVSGPEGHFPMFYNNVQDCGKYTRPAGGGTTLETSSLDYAAIGAVKFETIEEAKFSVLEKYSEEI